MIPRISRLLNRKFSAGLKFLNNTYSTEPSVSIVKKTTSGLSFNPWCTVLYQEHSKHISNVNFSPKSISLEFNLQSNLIHPSRQVLDIPLPSKAGIFHFPTDLSISKVDIIINENIIDAPSVNGITEKRAARLIVIRRRKMKKHKLRKLRKKMKFEWAKVRQRREMRKEKAFQAELLAQIKQAEAFDAAQYVAEKLRKAQEKKLPRKWKGRRLPEFIIKQKLGIKD